MANLTPLVQSKLRSSFQMFLKSAACTSAGTGMKTDIDSAAAIAQGAATTIRINALMRNFISCR